MNGEGHYLALFRKKGEAIPYETEEKPIEKKNKNRKTGKRPRNGSTGSVESRKTDPFRFPVPDDSTDPGGGTGSPRRKSIPFPSLPDGVRNLHFLRNGLYLGELKKTVSSRHSRLP